MEKPLPSEDEGENLQSKRLLEDKSATESGVPEDRGFTACRCFKFVLIVVLFYLFLGLVIENFSTDTDEGTADAAIGSTPNSDETFNNQDTCSANSFLLGDGVCDEITNTERCLFDKGDCCLENKNVMYCQECSCKLSDVDNDEFDQELAQLDVAIFDLPDDESITTDFDTSINEVVAVFEDVFKSTTCFILCKEKKKEEEEESGLDPSLSWAFVFRADLETCSCKMTERLCVGPKISSVKADNHSQIYTTNTRNSSQLFVNCSGERLLITMGSELTVNLETVQVSSAMLDDEEIALDESLNSFKSCAVINNTFPYRSLLSTGGLVFGQMPLVCGGSYLERSIDATSLCHMYVHGGSGGNNHMISKWIPVTADLEVVFIREELWWEKANNYCKDLRGQLFEPRNWKVLLKVATRADQIEKVDKVWIGLHNVNDREKFQYASDNSYLSFEDNHISPLWLRGQPIDDIQKRFVYMVTETTLWGVDGHMERKPFICQRKIEHTTRTHDKTWTLVGSMLMARSRSASVLFRDRLFITGGHDEQGITTRTTEYFIPAKDLTIDEGQSYRGLDMPQYIEAHCMVKYRTNRVIVIGGRRSELQTRADETLAEDEERFDTSHLMLSSTWIYDESTINNNVKSSSWTQGPNARLARYSHGCVSAKDVDGNVIVIMTGGQTRHGHTSTTEVLSVMQSRPSKWKQGPEIPIDETDLGHVVLVRGRKAIFLLGSTIAHTLLFKWTTCSMDSIEHCQWTSMQIHLKQRKRQFMAWSILGHESIIDDCIPSEYDYWNLGDDWHLVEGVISSGNNNATGLENQCETKDLGPGTVLIEPYNLQVLLSASSIDSSSDSGDLTLVLDSHLDNGYFKSSLTMSDPHPWLQIEFETCITLHHLTFYDYFEEVSRSLGIHVGFEPEVFGRISANPLCDIDIRAFCSFNELFFGDNQFCLLYGGFDLITEAFERETNCDGNKLEGRFVTIQYRTGDYPIPFLRIIEVEVVVSTTGIVDSISPEDDTCCNLTYHPKEGVFRKTAAVNKKWRYSKIGTYEAELRNDNTKPCDGICWLLTYGNGCYYSADGKSTVRAEVGLMSMDYEKTCPDETSASSWVQAPAYELIMETFNCADSMTDTLPSESMNQHLGCGYIGDFFVAA